MLQLVCAISVLVNVRSLAHDSLLAVSQIQDHVSRESLCTTRQLITLMTDSPVVI